MAEGLPEGLITNKENVADEIQRLYDVEVEDVIKLWKVYSASKNILPDGAGQRLANFLWRVWGSEKILHHLTGSQLALHFSAISEDGPLRTTPTQSPRVSRNLSAAINTSQSREQVLPPPSGTSKARAKPTSPSQEEEKKEKTRLPPILKRPQEVTSMGRTEASRVSAQSTLSADGEDDSTPSTTPSGKTLKTNTELRGPYSTKQPVVAGTSTSEADSDSMPESSGESPETLQRVSSEDTVRPPSEAAPKAKRTKTVFHASARKRPVVTKRKSSQSSSTVSPRPSAATSGLQDTSGPRTAEVAAQKPLESSEPSKPSPPLPSPQLPSQPPNTLVEPDFRTKFVEKTRSAQSSFVNLPSLLRKPTPSSAAPTSYQAAGTMGLAHPPQPTERGRGRGKVTFTEGSKPPGPAGPDIQLNRGGEGEGAEAGLPRTESQLTLLLERQKEKGPRARGRGS
ncbi:hypothetical protein G7Y79_00002g005100 [Physcia stellaris]|nr:hypothetical protein G7Y79_00002g005100 [Physcia stellaris]